MIQITKPLIITISFLLSYVLYKSSIKFFKKYLLDKPNERSSHIISKPRGGGIVFILIYFLFSIVSIFNYGFTFNSILPFLFLPLIVTSLIDDFYNISIKYRFASQIFTSSILVINYLSRFEQQLLINNALLFFVFLFCAVSVINFINFLDGIDGLISGSFLTILFFLSFNNSLDFGLLSLIGGLAGFIIFNWEPSKIFMGDIGSTFLGAIYLSLVFNQESLKNSFSILLIFIPLFLDAISTLIRRIINKQNVFSAHKLHLYQRLNQSGMSHSNVSLIYIFAVGILSITFVFGNFSYLILASICFLIISLYFDRVIAVKFKKY